MSDGYKRYATEKYVEANYSLKSKLSTISLLASGWIGTDSPYRQIVTIDCVAENSKVDLQPTESQIATLQDAEISLVASNDNGVVTIYAVGGKPKEDYTIQVVITEANIISHGGSGNTDGNHGGITIEQAEAIKANTIARHKHDNINTLDKLNESENNLTYDGKRIIDESTLAVVDEYNALYSLDNDSLLCYVSTNRKGFTPVLLEAGVQYGGLSDNQEDNIDKLWVDPLLLNFFPCEAFTVTTESVLLDEARNLYCHYEFATDGSTYLYFKYFLDDEKRYVNLFNNSSAPIVVDNITFPVGWGHYSYYNGEGNVATKIDDYSLYNSWFGVPSLKFSTNDHFTELQNILSAESTYAYDGIRGYYQYYNGRWQSINFAQISFNTNSALSSSHSHYNQNILNNITWDIFNKDIPVVHTLPTEAADGDMCLYSPMNIIESGKRIYFDWQEFAKPIEGDCVMNSQAFLGEHLSPDYLDFEDCAFEFSMTRAESFCNISVGINPYMNINIADYTTTYYINFDENGNLVESSTCSKHYFVNDTTEEIHYSSIDELPKYIDIPEYDFFIEDSSLEAPVPFFYAPYRLMVYQGDEWKEVPSDLSVECSIPTVHTLPIYAKDGDMCLYSPANTIESGKRIYFDWEEFAKLPSISEETGDSEEIGGVASWVDDYVENCVFDFFARSRLFNMVINSLNDSNIADYTTTYLIEFDENGNLIEGSMCSTYYFANDTSEEIYYSSIDELPKYIDILDFNRWDENAFFEATTPFFYAPYRLMVYRAGEWQRVETLLDIEGGSVDLTDYYTKQEIDDKGFITAEDIPEVTIITDPTLTIEGGVADAKATGDRLTDIEYQTVTTDLAYEHKGLPIGEKTVTVNGDNTWGDTVYAVGSADLIPRKTFSRKFPYNGITIEKSDLTYHISGTATAKDNIYFIEENGNANIAFPNAAGKSFKMLTFSDKVIGNVLNFFVKFYDSNGATVQTLNKWGNLANQVSSQIGGTALTTVVPFSVPKDANISYMKVRLDTVADTTYDNDFQVYIVPDNETQTATLTNGIAEFSGITANDVMSIPYSSTVKIEALLKSYIDYKTANAKGDTATYLTPEAFGAIGDGYANDIEAITACLAKAAETKQTVLMAQKYLVSAPIDIKGDDFNIIINDIVYNGTDTAVEIQGQRNTVKIHSITSSGIGVKFIGDGTKYSEWTLYNDLEVNTITANSHGIIFESITVALYQNTVRFNLISAGGDGCYGIAYVFGENGTYITENNFYGGQISNCEWACYRVAGNSRLMNIQVEGNVKGGFYITGYVNIVNPRWAEAWRDGEYPFLKFACGVKEGSRIKIENNVPIPINEIDLSENSDKHGNDSGQQFPTHETRLAVLNCPIHSRSFGVGLDAQSSINYTHKAYVWGKYLIMTPFMAYRKEVTTETLDTRLIGQEETEAEIQAFAQLPTKFVVNSTNTEIYLHESYCAFGFNEFEVEQANGFTCKIYDKLNNLIFDGSNQGDGLYKFNVYKDATYCASRSGILRVDFLGHYWSVTKESISATDDGQGNVTLTTGVISI